MLFNTISYVLFLWTVYVVWWSLRRRRSWRHTFVLLASYWFYGQSHWAYVSLLALSTLVDYVAGGSIARARERDDGRAAKRWLWMSLSVNLGVLAVFKYFDFFSSNVEALLGRAGFEAHTWRLDLILPVGISFYTFQTLSYTIDIYRGHLAPARSLLDFATYVAFFPQLVAGPIVRAVEFLPQLDAPRPPTHRRVGGGLFLIVRGLVKKMLMADLLATHLLDPVFGSTERMAALGAPGIWLVGLAFFLQLYLDFSGYTDVALGSAQLLGFELCPNFDKPFRQPSLDRFWQRWHISMSSWFRDYVYIGLGGSRLGLARACLNSVMTMTLVGMWHGANWNYIVFGWLHGMGLAGTRLFRAAVGDRAFRESTWWRGIGWLLTLNFVVLTGLIIRAPSVEAWVGLLAGLGDWSRTGVQMTWQIWLILALAFSTHLMPRSVMLRVGERFVGWPAVLQAASIVMAALLLFALQPSGVVPYFYFQF